MQCDERRETSRMKEGDSNKSARGKEEMMISKSEGTLGEGSAQSREMSSYIL